MKKKLAVAALATAAALVFTGCSAPAGSGDDAGSADGQDITLWLMGGATPDELRTYLKDTYKTNTGGTLTIEEQGWGDAIAKLTTSLPDSANTPDVVEIGNTWSPTFTTAGAFTDLSDIYDELGGEKLLQSFVEVGEVDGAQYALPYYFGSRYNFYRKDIWAAAGVTAPPATLADFAADAAKLKTDTQSGFYLGGSDWRNGISWIFANGGELAAKDGDQWVSTLASDDSVKGLTQFQELFQSASLAPATEFDSTPWVNLNNNEATGVPEAATIIAPGWAHGSLGDLAPDPADATKTVATWNDDVFGVFVLPGVDGGAAPVFAGGSNIAISAASEKQAGSKELLKIVFSEEYQNLLGANGLGPANMDYASSLGDDQFATALIESAQGSKLTPAAPGWAAVEGAGLLEEFFGKVAAGGDVAELAAEYDTKITKLLN